MSQIKCLEYITKNFIFSICESVNRKSSLQNQKFSYSVKTARALLQFDEGE